MNTGNTTEFGGSLENDTLHRLGTARANRQHNKGTADELTAIADYLAEHGKMRGAYFAYFTPDDHSFTGEGPACVIGAWAAATQDPKDWGWGARDLYNLACEAIANDDATMSTLIRLAQESKAIDPDDPSDFDLHRVITLWSDYTSGEEIIEAIREAADALR